MPRYKTHREKKLKGLVQPDDGRSNLFYSTTDGKLLKEF